MSTLKKQKQQQQHKNIGLIECIILLISVNDFVGNREYAAPSNLQSGFTCHLLQRNRIKIPLFETVILCFQLNIRVLESGFIYEEIMDTT